MDSATTASGARTKLRVLEVQARFSPQNLIAGVVRSALTLTAVSALLLSGFRTVWAEAPKETVLYNFCPVEPSCTAGGGLLSPLTSDSAGNLYGTTSYGGPFDGGTVFELSPSGKGGWDETNLYNFCSLSNCADGGGPNEAGVIFDKAGNLYGTTYDGGEYGYGVVFKLRRTGKSWTETVLHSFTGGADGADPETGVIIDSAGSLYGTTMPTYAPPTVFKLSRSAGGWKKEVISRVTTYYAGLTIDAAGNIFGIGYVRGKSSVFKLSPNRDGWDQTVLYTFGERNIGAQGTPVLDHAGNLYGTTVYGGADNNGTVYRLSPTKGGSWTENRLYSFDAQTQVGNNPWGGVVLDSTGNIYGTTSYGGEYGYGTVFELHYTGKGSYKERVLCNLDDSDGYDPAASLIRDGSGNLYGTTYFGGALANGVAFKVTP